MCTIVIGGSKFVKYEDNWQNCFYLHTFCGGISNRAPSSSKVILLYSLLADNRLCSITALSRMLEPKQR